MKLEFKNFSFVLPIEKCKFWNIFLSYIQMMTEVTGVAEKPKQRMSIELKENLILNMLTQGEWLEMFK